MNNSAYVDKPYAGVNSDDRSNRSNSEMDRSLFSHKVKIKEPLPIFKYPDSVRSSVNKINADINGRKKSMDTTSIFATSVLSQPRKSTMSITSTGTSLAN